MDVVATPLSKLLSFTSLKQKFCDLVASPRQSQKRARELEELTLESQPALAPSARGAKDPLQTHKQRRLLPLGTPRQPYSAAPSLPPTERFSLTPPLAGTFASSPAAATHYGVTYNQRAASRSTTPWTPSRAPAFSPLQLPQPPPQPQQQAYRWTATPPAKSIVQYSDSYVKPSPSNSRERPRFSPGVLDTRRLILVGGRLRDIESSHLAELERLRPPAGAWRSAQATPSSSIPHHPADVPEDMGGLMEQFREKRAQVQRIMQEDEQRQRARAVSTALRGDAIVPRAGAPPVGEAPTAIAAAHARPLSTPSTPLEQKMSALTRFASGCEAARFDALVRKANPTHVEAANSQGRDREIQLLEERLRIEHEVSELGAEIAAAHIRETVEGADEEKEGAAAVDTFLLPLSEQQEQRVDEALAPGDGSEILATNSFTNIQVRRSDMACLEGLGWLNDEVINFYMGMLQERELRANPGKPKSHFCNTFFYAKLAGDSGYKYQGVRRWTMPKKLGHYDSILDCDKIIVPIHQGVHWVLGVVHLAEKRLEFFDSMGGSDKGALANLARYVMDEFQDKRKETVDTSSWAKASPKDIPHQHNYSDCGVFMATFANYVSRDASYGFTQEDMPTIRRHFVANILENRVE